MERSFSSFIFTCGYNWDTSATVQNNDGTYVCSVVRKAEEKGGEMNKQSLTHFYAV